MKQTNKIEKLTSPTLSLSARALTSTLLWESQLTSLNHLCHRAPSHRPIHYQFSTLVVVITLYNLHLRSLKSACSLSSYCTFCRCAPFRPIQHFSFLAHCSANPAPICVLPVASDSIQRTLSFGSSSCCPSRFVPAVHHCVCVPALW